MGWLWVGSISRSGHFWTKRFTATTLSVTQCNKMFTLHLLNALMQVKPQALLRTDSCLNKNPALWTSRLKTTTSQGVSVSVPTISQKCCHSSNCRAQSVEASTLKWMEQILHGPRAQARSHSWMSSQRLPVTTSALVNLWRLVKTSNLSFMRLSSNDLTRSA